MSTSPMYSKVTFKASHNSYARSEQPVTDQLHRPRSRSLHQAGCRGLELDLIESSKLWHWSVKHDGDYDGAADAQLAAHLRHLRLWSARHPDHDVITITLDVKQPTKDLRSFPYYLDCTIEEELGEDLLFTPSDLRGQHESLVAGAAAHGWPTLDELTGRFILCLSGDEKTKKAYAAGGDRLAFADVKVSGNGRLPSPTSGDRVFVNFDLGDARWRDNVREIAKRPAFVSRVFTSNDEASWKAAMRARVNIIATDKIRDHPWATVGHRSLFRPF